VIVPLRLTELNLPMRRHVRMPVLRLEEFLRIFFEFREAVLAAKIISLPVVRVLSRSRARL
jgi:hypothetical protein